MGPEAWGFELGDSILNPSLVMLTSHLRKVSFDHTPKGRGWTPGNIRIGRKKKTLRRLWMSGNNDDQKIVVYTSGIGSRSSSSSF